jgi:negative regulator of flagellin synthesis FlgM
MKIQNTFPGVEATPVPGAAGRGENRLAADIPPAGTGGDGGTVRIDPRASLLAAAETNIARAPAVDSKRVEEIKRAIAEGRFEVDSAKVADRLLGSARDLLLTRSG